MPRLGRGVASAAENLPFHVCDCGSLANIVIETVKVVHQRESCRVKCEHGRSTTQKHPHRATRVKAVVGIGLAKPVNPFDVDNSGTVQALDVYITLNDYIAKRGALPGRAVGSTEPFCDVNGDNQLTPADVLESVTGLNNYVNNPLALTLDLNGESDGNANEVVLKPQVKYAGTTLPYSKVKLIPVGSGTNLSAQEVVSDRQGKFEFQLNLTGPLNHVKITVDDPRERTVSVEREIRLGNVVSDWNAMVLEVIRESTAPSSTVPGLLIKPPPPLAARQLAMIQTAMFDAINAVNPNYQGYAFDATGPQSVSEVAAARPPPTRLPRVCLMYRPRLPYGMRH